MAKLYHPDGRPYETSDPVEITRLKAHGYTEDAPSRTATSRSSDTTKKSSSRKQSTSGSGS